MKTVDLIEHLEATSSLNEKKGLIKEAFMAGNREFFTGARMAYNKLISFGVKKVPLIEEDQPLNEAEQERFSFGEFAALANKLKRRELTGHAARDALLDAAEIADVREWNTFYRRVLLRDLKVNAGASLINAVLKDIEKLYAGTPDAAEAREYVIPVFECQLAEDSKKHPKKMKGRKLLDIKLDGARMLTVLDKENRTVRQFSRSGIEMDNFPNITAALMGVLDELPMSIVLDGEMLGGTFQQLMTQFQRKDADTSDMKLGLFDIIPLADFQAGHCSIPQEKRHENLVELQLSGLLQKHTGDMVYVIPKMEVDLDTPEGHAAMREYFEEAVAAGFEGIMIKDPSAPYEGRKWSAWLKWKPVISVTLRVTGLEQGKPDSEFSNTLGALVLEGVDSVEQHTDILIKSNCGSGFDKKTRDEWWANPKLIVDHLVEIEADAVSLASDADHYSLRFPRFKGFRGTKPGEKI